MIYLPPHAADVLYLFGFPNGADCHNLLFWTGTKEEIRFYAQCSDTFAWGTADAEEILEEDVPLLQQSFHDLLMLGDAERDYVYLLPVLFAARKRNRRPMDRFFDWEPDEVLALFPDKQGSGNDE